MVFTKQDIPSQLLCIIDIGSYKLRVCAASFKNKRIEVLGYHEKRQDSSYFSNQECKNLPGLCQNISDAIKKLEQELDISLHEIVINYPFGEIFLASKKIHHTRKNPLLPLEEEELISIMLLAEQQCLRQLTQEVEALSGLREPEIQVLLSRVNHVSLDGRQQEKILGETGEKMSISLVNASIPLAKHNLLSQIGNALGKKIFRILPTEFCITKIFQESDIVILNVGATQTTISLKQEGEVQSLAKISIGINDLVSKIGKNSALTKAEIIEHLMDPQYLQERQEFLSVWGESIGISLQEMLQERVCPKTFFIGGGGGNNLFFQEYLENFSFAKYDIRSLNKISFTQEDVAPVFKTMKSIRLQDVQKIPLDMYVLLLETNHLLYQERDIISGALKKAIEQLGYIKS